MEGGKLCKKQRRKEAMLLTKEPGFVQFQKESSVHVLVSNAGMVTGLSRAAVQILVPSADSIYMPACRDYCYVTFASVAVAEEAVKAHNGVCVQTVKDLWDLLPMSLQNGPPLHLFLSYIARLPPFAAAAADAKKDVMKRGLVNGEHEPEATDPQLPPGLLVLEEFITEDKEAILMAWLTEEYSCVDSGEILKQREVRHYGFRFDYSSNSVDHTSPLSGDMPHQLTEMIESIQATGLIQHSLDQITINKYPPGAGIPPHVDTHSVFLENIVSLSLGSQVVMEFSAVSQPPATPSSQPPATPSPKLPVILPARSLLIMKGASRYGYTHAIPSRTFDPVPLHSSPGLNRAAAMTTVPRGTRISMTFRGVRSAPLTCSCDFPWSCDYQSSIM